jgi:hypothetical protein
MKTPYKLGQWVRVISSPGGHYNGKIGICVGISENQNEEYAKKHPYDVEVIFDGVGIPAGIKYFMPEEIEIIQQAHHPKVV